ncbi:hypothetical protein IAD21_05837 [Abditibacteriota bacterium]|nr:hypothetical protein IAD21_05837 [Abditibacteriota bacterium]
MAISTSVCSAQRNAVPIAGLRPALAAAVADHVKVVPVGGTGWAKSSVNAAVFRTSSLITHDDTQYIAYYDGDNNVVLGKRKLGSATWELKTTQYKGDAKDAHNCISIGVDGKGFLHMVWDLHNGKLRYVKSTEVGSLELSAEMPMTGKDEARVTYPQFYTLPSGDLLFLYRDGASGNGNAMLNRYNVETGEWSSVQHPLVAGGGQRNAYLNTLAIDGKGGIHLSWVWRDTPDVATNHDVCYAYSPDQGKTWQKSTGDTYQLPITIDNAEVAWSVPKNSELINQTSMTVDAAGHPFIATYWRPAGTEVPQYQLVWHDGTTWHQNQVSQRTQGFRLSGGGTKKIPISRPQVVAGKDGAVHVIFRDEELGNGISVASSKDANHNEWTIVDLLQQRVGAWEPTYDANLWAQKGQLNLFVQRVGQGDAETLENVPPQDVSVLEWTP